LSMGPAAVCGASRSRACLFLLGGERTIVGGVDAQADVLVLTLKVKQF
jgi:hypothetical protein